MENWCKVYGKRKEGSIIDTGLMGIGGRYKNHIGGDNEMSQVEERIRNEEAELAALSAGERLTVICGLWPSLPAIAQVNVIRLAACVMGLSLPEADSDLAAVLSIWPSLTSATRRAVARVAGL